MRLLAPLKSTLSPTKCAIRYGGGGGGALSPLARRHQLLPASSCYDVASRQSRLLHTDICPKRSVAIDGWKYSNHRRQSFFQSRVVTLYQKRQSGNTNSPQEKPEPTTDSKEQKPRVKAKLLSRLPMPVHENIYTVPNILTFSRLLAAPAVGYLLVHNHHTAALSLFAYAGITDLVDGYIARKYNLQTVVGTIIDPAADKLLMTISVVCLALNGWMPAWLAVLILGRDVGLSISAIYYRWISLPPPKTMARYWDFSLPSAEVKPTGISKVNTALQLLLVGSSIALPVLPASFAGAWGLYDGLVGLHTYDHRVWKTGLPVRSAVLKPHAGWLVVGWVTTSESQLLYLVAATTIWSGLSYVFSKDAVKILSDKEIQQRITRASKKEDKR